MRKTGQKRLIICKISTNYNKTIKATTLFVVFLFVHSWEQRKFGETVQIERGGSPRPIDDFITTAPDGLNWVKIGDAPEQGNYITKTAEKIKPSGLSKTREVHPNDLILSNSMSFGKPYIMAINGCIHDGWLLIRDNQERFDLKFLCHLLGTPQMLSQYKSMAAGSTVNNLNKELVGNTTVTFPTKQEQQKIGKSFELLDNLITLHQRKVFNVFLLFLRTKTFDFLTISWEQRKLGEVSESYSGGTPSVGVKKYYGGEIAFIRSAEINSEATELFLTEEGLKNSSARLVAVGDILYALYGATSGEVGRARLKGAINQAILAIKPHTGYDSEYLAQWLRKSKHSIIETYLQGGQGNLSGTIVKELSADFPSLKEQQAIGDFFSQLDNLITLHQCECFTIIQKYSLFLVGCNKPNMTHSWEQRKFDELYEKVSEKNDLTYGTDKIISVANMYFKSDSFITDIEYLRTYNVFHLGDIAFEGNKSKNFAHGRFVENTIGDGIVSHVFDVFRPKPSMICYFGNMR